MPANWCVSRRFRLSNGCRIPSTGFAQVVVDRLRNDVADPSVRIGAILLDKRKLGGSEVDRRAHQAFAGVRRIPTCERPIFDDLRCFKCRNRCRYPLSSVRVRRGW
jgi:hypothetical protein